MKCLTCGDTGFTALGEPCTECDAKDINIKRQENLIEFNPVYGSITEWNKNFIQKKVKEEFIKCLEEILASIKRQAVPKNYFIFSDANTSRTVFSFYVKHLMQTQGYLIPPMTTLAELQTRSVEEILSQRVLFIKLVNDNTFNPTGRIEYLLNLRNKFDKATIIFYTGGKHALAKEFDHYGKLNSLMGSGEFNSFKPVYGSTHKEVEEDVQT